MSALFRSANEQRPVVVLLLLLAAGLISMVSPEPVSLGGERGFMPVGAASAEPALGSLRSPMNAALPAQSPVSGLQTPNAGPGVCSGCSDNAALTDTKLSASDAPAKSQPTENLNQPKTRGSLKSLYKVGLSDVLAVKVFKFPEISGEFAISYDGTISVLPLGAINVKGLDCNEISELLVNKISAMTKRPVYVSVEVKRFRPIFVVGLVDKPGSYLWEPNYTVLQALALAGGFVRAEATSSIARDREIGSVTEKLDLLRRALVHRARLQAEREGSTNIALPDRLSELASPQEVRELMAQEQRLLSQRLNAIKTNQDEVRRATQNSEREISALEGRKSTIKRQVELQEASFATVQRLLSTGNSVNARVNEIQSRIAQLQGQDIEIDGLLSQAKQRQGDLERTPKANNADRMIEMEKELASVEKDIANYGAAISSSGGVLNRMMQTDGLSPSELEEERIFFQIVRTTGEGSKVIEANEMTQLKPGDILKVQRATPRRDCVFRKRMSAVRSQIR